MVLRTTELRVGPLSSVDEQFAWDEGEYDRTLETWLDGHRSYFRRSCERIGLEFSDDLEVCFERFRVVWPPSTPTPSVVRAPAILPRTGTSPRRGAVARRRGEMTGAGRDGRCVPSPDRGSAGREDAALSHHHREPEVVVAG